MTKAEIRSQQKELRHQLNKEEQIRLSNQNKESLLNTEAYLASKNLFTFVSITDEVDTLGIITETLLRGKKVFIPRIEARKMEFYQIENLEHLIRSKFGILEPEICEEKRFTYENSLVENSSLTDQQDHQYHNLMLLPGLAFDRNGNRIGYGAGYYDKYIASFPDNTFYKIALAFEFQLLEHIPAEAYDQKADVIITPTEVHYCNPV